MLWTVMAIAADKQRGDRRMQANADQYCRVADPTVDAPFDLDEEVSDSSAGDVVRLCRGVAIYDMA